MSSSGYDQGIDAATFTEYDGVSLENWLDVFLEYALLLAQDGNVSCAYKTLQDAYDANVFYYSPGFIFRVQICWSRKSCEYI